MSNCRLSICYPFLFFLVMLAAQCCLDPNQTIGNCTQCPTTQVLLESNCYDKMKGCMTYKIVNKTLLCDTCQLGYLPYLDKCERKAVVDSLTGTNLNQSFIPPVLPDNPPNLTRANITGSPGAVAENGTAEHAKNLSRPLPVFPELKIITMSFPQNITKTSIFWPPKRTSIPSLPGALEKVIVAKFPNLQNNKIVQVGYENENKNAQFFNQDKVWVMYEDATILLLEKNRKPDSGPKADRGGDRTEATPDYTITELFHHRNLEKQVAKIKGQLLQKIPQALVSSLGINYNLKLANNRTVSLNLDLSTGQVSCLSSSEWFQDCFQILSRVSETPKYNQYLKYSYSQFLQKISVVNVPETVIVAQMYRNDSSEANTDFVFRIVYNGASSPADQEYSLFRYQSSQNTTEILGYFIENNNVLTLLKQPQPASSVTEHPTSIKQNINGSWQNGSNLVNTSSNAGNSLDESSNFAQISKKPLLGSALGKNTTRTDFPSINSTSISASASGMVSDKQVWKELKQRAEKPKLLTSIIKTENDFINYLLKTPIASNLSRGFKLFSLKNESEGDKQTYRAQIVTFSSVLSLTLVENLENNQLAASSQLENEYSCIELSNDSVALKIDGYLRKSYPMLQSFNRLVSQFRLDLEGEKYYLIYVNDRKARIVFEVTKKRDSTNYVISKNEPHDYGYCYQKNFEAINFNLSELSEELFQEDSKYPFLKPFSLILGELLGKYRSYVYNSNIQAIASNSTHAKIYLSNKFATFEYRTKLEDAKERESRGQFTLIEQKYGNHILPLGFKKQKLVSSGDAQYGTYKIIEESLIKRYKNYFGGGNLEVFAQRRPNQQGFDIAFKTVLGFFSLVATPTSRQSLSVTPLRKVQQFEEAKMPICKESQYLDSRDRRCYTKIVGCFRQIASICIMCNPELILQSGRKECRRTCGW